MSQQLQKDSPDISFSPSYLPLSTTLTYCVVLYFLFHEFLCSKDRPLYIWSKIL